MDKPYSAAVDRAILGGLITQEEADTMPEPWLKMVAQGRKNQQLQIAHRRKSSVGYIIGRRVLGPLVLLLAGSLLVAGIVAVWRSIFGG